MKLVRSKLKDHSLGKRALLKMKIPWYVNCFCLLKKHYEEFQVTPEMELWCAKRNYRKQLNRAVKLWLRFITRTRRQHHSFGRTSDFFAACVLRVQGLLTVSAGSTAGSTTGSTKGEKATLSVGVLSAMSGMMREEHGRDPQILRQKPL